MLHMYHSSPQMFKCMSDIYSWAGYSTTRVKLFDESPWRDAAEPAVQIWSSQCIVVLGGECDVIGTFLESWHLRTCWSIEKTGASYITDVGCPQPFSLMSSCDTKLPSLKNKTGRLSVPSKAIYVNIFWCYALFCHSRNKNLLEEHCWMMSIREVLEVGIQCWLKYK